MHANPYYPTVTIDVSMKIKNNPRSANEIDKNQKVQQTKIMPMKDKTYENTGSVKIKVKDNANNEYNDVVNQKCSKYNEKEKEQRRETQRANARGLK